MPRFIIVASILKIATFYLVIYLVQTFIFQMYFSLKQCGSSFRKKIVASMGCCWLFKTRGVSYSNKRHSFNARFFSMLWIRFVLLNSQTPFGGPMPCSRDTISLFVSIPPTNKQQKRPTIYDIA